jgi:hypothetical protein
MPLMSNIKSFTLMSFTHSHEFDHVWHIFDKKEKKKR